MLEPWYPFLVSPNDYNSELETDEAIIREAFEKYQKEHRKVYKDKKHIKLKKALVQYYEKDSK